MKEEIKRLEELILYHKRKYYDEEPEISDSEYDSLEERLRELDPNNPILFIVGTPKGGTVSHNPPMLSCQKAKDVDKILSWAGEKEIIMGYKVDGLSLKLIYDKKRFIQAATRGSGTKGDNVTLNIMKVDFIPKTIPFEGRVDIRGELFMRISEFNRINSTLPSDQKYSNPRNLASGTIKQKDPKMLIGRELDFMPWDLLGWKEKASSKEKLEILKKWSFIPSDFLVIENPDFDTIREAFQEVEEERDNLDFEIDGVVFKYNKEVDKQEVGSTDHHPRWQIALKFESKGSTTKLKNITWQVGRTSVLTPVAELEPVEVAGAVISRATLHNADFLINLGAKPGDIVYVERSGEVIPKIIKVTAEYSKGEVKLPDSCPSCGSKTHKSGVNLLCTGKFCRDRDIQEITYWIRITGIDGLGGKSLEKLYDTGMVKHYSDLYSVKESQLVNLLGKNGTKIYSSIESTREMPFRTFLAGLGIESLGRTMGRKLAKQFANLEELRNASIKKLTSLEGISDITANNIQSGIREKNRYENLFKNGLKIIYSEKKQIHGIQQSWQQSIDSYLGTATKQIKIATPLKVYISGKVEDYSKEDLRDFLEAKGIEWGSGVTKNLDYLVLAEKAGEKRKEQAKKLGVKMIDWEEFSDKYLK